MKKLKLEELGRVSPEEYRGISKLPISILLDNVRSMHNVGSAFRTADAFRIEKVFLGGITARPPHREIHKTALGATETVSWEHVQDPQEVVKKLQSDGYTVILIEQTTKSLPLQSYSVKAGAKCLLVFGNEVSGISEELLELGDVALEIPQEGTKHSLNISVCLGVVCWEFFKKLS